jgi:2-oxoisovalerate dehydrogenase E2 component (dihydrolipoyl transacylase)
MAETKIPMPQLGESVTEGTIGKWLKKPGDKVNKYDPLCEVITDKVNAEVPSSVEGILGEILVPDGTTVEVGEIICTIIAEGAAEASSLSKGDPSAVQPDAKPDTKQYDAPQQKVATPGVSAAPTAQQAPMGQTSAPQKENGEKQRFSPAVLRLAQENDIDLSRIQGTGLGGRITRKDVLQAIEQGMTGTAINANAASAQAETISSAQTNAPASVNAPSPIAKSAASGTAVTRTEAGDQIIETSAVRRTIANRMLQSKHEIPHAWTMVEVDVTGLVKLREREKDAFYRTEGIKLTYMPFFIKAVVGALKEYPILNSVWEGERIVVKKAIHLSMAVATEDSLYTPVIRNADQKSITGIASDIEDLANRARSGKLKLEDMQGGTFTVNNTGSFGSIQSIPIINYPQAAIITMESIVKRPVVIQDMIAVRSMVNLCLSLDHRTLDGLVCGRFLQKVKQNLEEMGPDMKLY